MKIHTGTLKNIYKIFFVPFLTRNYSLMHSQLSRNKTSANVIFLPVKCLNISSRHWTRKSGKKANIFYKISTVREVYG
jgi:hypothetical protein